MSDKEADPNHCYECGTREVKHGSLFPMQPHTIVKTQPNGKEIALLRHDRDYNVCSPCYVKQWGQRYPGRPCPVEG